MTTSSIRRQMKNIVNNYSEAEIKVREATSNDPWGPSSSLMTEIADLTYNVVAFSEIMSMIWKRLNDHGKNWRHVYKALTLLDYLIKTGSERVAQQCKENIFAIQTLKDFQYIDRDGKDQGINVREKSKQLVSLLKDDERLKTERAQALKTKERMAQVATGVGSNQITFGRGSSQPNLSTSYSEQEYGKSGGSPASYHGCKYRLIPRCRCFALERCCCSESANAACKGIWELWGSAPCSWCLCRCLGKYLLWRGCVVMEIDFSPCLLSVPKVALPGCSCEHVWCDGEGGKGFFCLFLGFKGVLEDVFFLFRKESWDGLGWEGIWI